MLKIFFLFLFLCCNNFIFSQNFIKIYDNKALETLNLSDSSVFVNKKLASSFKTQIIIALQHYPNLKNVKIEFREKKIKTSMSAFPKWSNIYKSKKNRTYYININTYSKHGEQLLLKNVPFNAQIGVVGHELAHISDYHNKSNFRLLFNSVGYLFPRFRRKLEAKTDSITIVHGLGNQILNFSDYILTNPNLSEKYLKMKRMIYLSPKELSEIMKRNGY